MFHRLLLLPPLALLAALLVCSVCDAAPVMGIDMGTESFTVAVIHRGRFETAVNPESSKRKTPTLIGFPAEGRRLYGPPARNLRYRQPQRVVTYPTDLLALPYAHLNNEQYPPLLFPMQMVNDTERNGGVAVRLPGEDELVRPEEILGMLFKYCRFIAESYVEAKGVREAVVTVPPWLTTKERQARKDAAELGGVSVLSLMNEGTALALQYAMVRDVGNTNDTQYVVFYDMGHSSTKVAVVEFRGIFDAKKNTTMPQLHVLATAYDRHLGGRDFDLALALHLADIADQTLKPEGGSVRTQPRVMASLLKEAERVKETLSANNDVLSQIEGLVDDKDFRTQITRKKAEELWAPLLKRVAVPLLTAMNEAGVKAEQLYALEVVGGGVRVPVVQQHLLAASGRELLDKHVNGDEGIVSGAVLYAATLSAGLRVKDIKIKEPLARSVAVRFSPPITSAKTDAAEKKADDSSAKDAEKKDDADDLRSSATAAAGAAAAADEASEESIAAATHSASVLFRAGAPGGAKKKVAFRTVHTEFSVELLELAAPLDGNDESALDDALAATGANAPALLGRYNLTGFNALKRYENTVGRPKVHASFRLDDSNIADFESAEAEVIVVQPVKAEPIKESLETEAVGEKKGDEASESASSTPTPAPKRRVQKVPLRVVPVQTGWISAEAFRQSDARIRAFDMRDEALRELEQAKNDLESFIYSARERIDSDSTLKKYSTSKERSRASDAIAAAAKWMEEEATDESPAADYRQQLREAKAPLEKIDNRMEEDKARPKAVADIRAKVERTLVSLKDVVEQRNVTAEELERLSDDIAEFEKWLTSKLAEQEKRKLSDDAAFSLADMRARYTLLETTAKALLRRPKRSTPTPSSSSSPGDAKSTDEKPPSDSDSDSNDGEKTEEQQQRAQNEKHAHTDDKAAAEDAANALDEEELDL